MSGTKRILVALIVVLLASPALAFYNVLDDRLDQVGGQGVAIIHVVDNIFAKVWYIDTNGDGEYSAGDERLRMVLFRQ